MKLINQNWKTAYAASAKRGKIRGKRTPVIGYELIHVYHVTQNAPCQFKFFKAEQVSDVKPQNSQETFNFSLTHSKDLRI